MQKAAVILAAFVLSFLVLSVNIAPVMASYSWRTLIASSPNGEYDDMFNGKQLVTLGGYDYLVYQDFSTNYLYYKYSRTGGYSWSSSVQVSHTAVGDNTGVRLAAADNNIYIFYAVGTTCYYRVATQNAGGSLSLSSQVAFDESIMENVIGGTTLVTDTHVYIAYVSSDLCRLIVYRAELGSTTFTKIQSTITSSDSNAMRPIIGYDRAYNRVVVTWKDSSDNIGYALYDGSSWTEKRTFSCYTGTSLAEWLHGETIGDYYYMPITNKTGGELCIYRLDSDGYYEYVQTLDTSVKAAYIIGQPETSNGRIFYAKGSVGSTSIYTYAYNPSTGQFDTQQTVVSGNTYDAYTWNCINYSDSFWHIMYYDKTSPYPIYIAATDIKAAPSNIVLANVTFYMNATEKAFANVSFVFYALAGAQNISSVSFYVYSSYGTFASLNVSVSVSTINQQFAYAKFDVTAVPGIIFMQSNFTIQAEEYNLPVLGEDNDTSSAIAILAGVLPLLLILLVPVYVIYTYVGSVAVPPTFALMSVVAYLGGLMPLAVLFICLLVSVIIMLKGYVNRGGGDG